MILILSFLVITEGHRRTGIVWIYTFPPLVFLLKNHKLTFLWNFMFIVIILPLALLSYLELFRIYHGLVYIRQVLGAHITVLCLFFFYSIIATKLIRIIGR